MSRKDYNKEINKNTYIDKYRSFMALYNLANSKNGKAKKYGKNCVKCK